LFDQPSDLLRLTSVRYDPATSPAEVRTINQKLRKAIETEGRRGPVEGLWWQLSLTMRSDDEPSAIGLLRITRDRDGGLNVTDRSQIAGFERGRGEQAEHTVRHRTGSSTRTPKPPLGASSDGLDASVR
jgi:hypothetical protein